LRVGLVASPGSEGYHDFLGQLTSSGFAFSVRVVPATVQGSAAPGAIATAIRALCRSDCELIVLVRGGGAKADLAAFETEVVARTIANATKPIWTGIGHTGDRSIADLVANRSFITPTECGHHLAVRLQAWWEERVVEPAAAETRDAQARARLTRAARTQVRVHRERVTRRAMTVRRGAPERVRSQQDAVRGHAARLGPLSTGHLAREAERVRSWQRLLVAYDVDRQLERGYSLTLTADGALVRSVADVKAGESITTRVADGAIRSGVEATERNSAQ
jgi:exodeoxyribonuclease VII large subunit